MSLREKQFEPLHQAACNAFPDAAALRLLVRMGLAESQSEIPPIYPC